MANTTKENPKKKVGRESKVAARTAIPASVQLEVMKRGKRRCPLCFGLYGHTNVKQGQIAHLDHNPDNNAPVNLVFLCLPHHDQYDSKTSQSKGILLNEIEAYAAELSEYLESLGQGGWIDSAESERSARGKRGTERIGLALYEARVPIYRVVRDFINKVTSNASVELDDLRGLSMSTDEALFLFDATTADLIREIFQRAVHLRLATQRLARLQQTHQPMSEKLVDDECELLTWFSGSVELWRQRVYPYLHLSRDIT